MPNRIQLKRTKGWRLPPGTVNVARPTIFGNPWSVKGAIASGLFPAEHCAEVCVEEFRAWLARDPSSPICSESKLLRGLAGRREQVLALLPGLRGKDLACWCKEGSVCHADVLLEIANREGA